MPSEETQNWPVCGKCSKPVDELIVYEKRGYTCSRVIGIVARCHGQGETLLKGNSVVFQEEGNG